MSHKWITQTQQNEEEKTSNRITQTIVYSRQYQFKQKNVSKTYRMNLWTISRSDLSVLLVKIQLISQNARFTNSYYTAILMLDITCWCVLVKPRVNISAQAIYCVYSASLHPSRTMRRFLPIWRSPMQIFSDICIHGIHSWQQIFQKNAQNQRK